MHMLFVVAYFCGGSLSRALTIFAGTYFFSASSAGWASQTTFSCTALAFKKFHDVEDIDFFDHA